MERKLNIYEKYMWISNEKNPFNLCIAIKFKGDLSLEVLKSALNITQKKRYLLNINVVRLSDELIYKKIYKKIPIEIKEKTDFRKEIENQIHTAFYNDSNPYIRLVYLKKDNYILLSFHHFIADGISVVSVVNELFEAISDLQNKKCSEFDEMLSQPSPKAIEEIIDYQKESSFLSNNTLKIIDNFKVINAGTIGSAKKSGCIFYELSKSDTIRLIKNCKKNKTTIQGALFSSMLQSLSEKIRKENNSLENLEMTYQCPVNLRPFLKKSISNDQLGCYISLLYFKKLINSQNFWDLARFTRGELKKQITKQLPFQTIFNLDRLLLNHTYEDLMNAIKRVEPIVGVSYLGKNLITKRNGNLTIDKIYFANAMHGAIYNENVFNLISMIFDDQLSLTFVYPKPLMPIEKATYLSKAVITKLGEIT